MISAAALALGAFLVLSPMQGQRSASADSEQVTASERAWSEAFLRHDLQALSKLLADDFVGIDGRGVVSDKAAELAEAKTPPPGTHVPVLVSEALSDVRVRIYGDTAVLTAINTARFSSRGTVSTVRYRRTTVWVRRDDRWQCVSFHGSRILEPSRS
jgi:ketosteroid isomerase-like protein